ncbi:MAG TPA: hypothetical protein VHM20_01995, partial [Gammaproteobacteria bacterium]|nr:hypothetical protein [Gammaproteobacteria bacterium]
MFVSTNNDPAVVNVAPHFWLANEFNSTQKKRHIPLINISGLTIKPGINNMKQYFFIIGAAAFLSLCILQQGRAQQSIAYIR